MLQIFITCTCKIEYKLIISVENSQPFKDSFRQGKYLEKVFIFLLSAMLFTVPLPLNVGSICVILFLAVCFSSFIKLNFNHNKVLLLPIALYILMCLSLLYTTNITATTVGLQKEFMFLIIPTAFLFLPKFQKETVYNIIRIYSFGMVIFALYCMIRATINYNIVETKDVFLFQNLVTVELNAIYIAAFSSLCLFYFVILENKKPIDFLGLYIIAIFIVLLNSKTVFFIDLILFACHYLFFSKTKLGVKSVTFIFIVTFFLLSVFFIKQVQDRIIAEYETAFVDNTIYKNNNQGQINSNTISLHRAWHDKNFDQNSFFPGTAYRIFQARIFREIIYEKKYLWITGLGFNTSDQFIKQKHTQHKLFKDINYHNFHNQYLQFFAEIGVFGFVLLLMMVFANLRNAIRNKDFLHIVFAVTMIILFLTESVLCRQRGIVFFITLYCLFNSISYYPDLKQKH